MSLRLDLPVIQNWDCHNCGGCCKQHLIEITPAERQRILDQKWTSADGIDIQPIEPMGGWIGKTRYRLAHRNDGSCVFLNEQGLCKIHAKFGEMGKPLACRVYPYAFHPAGNSVAVSLRFSCPSVVKNAGRALSGRPDLRRIAEEVVPAGASMSPPYVNPHSQVGWQDFHRFVDALDQTLADPSLPLVGRLLRGLVWTSLVGQSTFAKLQGARIDEFLQLILEAATDEVSQVPQGYENPSTVGRLYFRLLVGQYARKDTVADLGSGWSGRWKLLSAIWRFSRGKGNIPPMQDIFRSVPFAALDVSFGPMTSEMEQIMTRYFRVKVQGIHFCGAAYYNVPFVEGFQSLVLILPATLWVARWLAVSDNRNQLTTDDLVRALAIVDHHHGYSPALGQMAARRRVRQLAETGDLVRLLLKYTS